MMEEEPITGTVDVGGREEARVTQASPVAERTRQEELDRLVESARRLPGVAEVVDVYGHLTTATEYGFQLVAMPETVAYATGGNAT